MTSASNEKWRKRVERCCIERGDGLYLRRESLLSSLVVVMIVIVAFWYFLSRPTVYNDLIEKASKQGWGALSPFLFLMLLFTGRPLPLPLAYLLSRWGRMSSDSLRRVLNGMLFVFVLAGERHLLWRPMGRNQL
ncbi:MAG: hypothetical protein LBI48_06605 [Burkholderiaceae bacterium]|jgi:hypothetical protein|nr:hypothetical protein [Burkholderiaceae bacterium]